MQTARSAVLALHRSNLAGSKSGLSLPLVCFAAMSTGAKAEWDAAHAKPKSTQQSPTPWPKVPPEALRRLRSTSMHRVIPGPKRSHPSSPGEQNLQPPQKSPKSTPRDVSMGASPDWGGSESAGCNPGLDEDSLKEMLEENLRLRKASAGRRPNPARSNPCTIYSECQFNRNRIELCTMLYRQIRELPFDGDMKTLIEMQWKDIYARP